MDPRHTEHGLMRVFKTGDTMKTDCTFFEDLILRYFFFFFSGRYVVEIVDAKEQNVAQDNKNILLLSVRLDMCLPRNQSQYHSKSAQAAVRCKPK